MQNHLRVELRTGDRESVLVSSLVKAHRLAREAGREFGIVNGGPRVRRLLSLTGVTERLCVADEPEELLSGG